MAPSFDYEIHPYQDLGDPYVYNMYFNSVTITWGELRDGGYIDWTNEKFAWDWYDTEQRVRLQNMMDTRFWMREISAIPPEVWRKQFIYTLNSAMRVAKLMYKALEDSAGPLAASDEYHKSREIRSDFPATLLNGSGGDYASDGRDYEYETIRDENLADALAKLQETTDPDVYVLNRLEKCFSSLVSVNVNGF